MLKLSIDNIIEKINNQEIFSAISDDKAFSIAIESYVPFVCTAIHNGGNLRTELRSNITLNKIERWLEEDPYTGVFISSLPIRIIAYDSRYEYDLNRSADESIYEEAWGKKVWKIPLTEEQKQLSMNKHANFYRVIDALITNIEQHFGACMVYDIHSFNFQRDERINNSPIFNIGTENIDTEKYDKYIKRWKNELGKIHIDSHKPSVAETQVFYGRGYLLKHLTEKFSNTLVLATEIKKLYVDEINGDEFPEIIENIQKGLKIAVINHAAYFAKNNTNMVVTKKYQLLSSRLDDSLKLVDSELFKMLKKVDLLEYLNPINIESEKKKYILSGYKNLPTFRYKPLPFDTNEIIRDLYQLPTEKIKDIHLKKLYEEIIDLYASKIELLTLRNQHKFLYSSLKNFGEPNENDLSNADFLLHCITQDLSEELYDLEETSNRFKEYAKIYGFPVHIEIVKNLAASVMVINSTKTLKLRKGSTFTATQINALANHEIGIHLLTTSNAMKQPLKFLRLGLPNKTVTQEGLAILAEYLSSSLTIGRLKGLALRVKAISLMIKGFTFNETFQFIIDSYNLNEEDAFYLCTRVYRGGGFTKDYLYLKGFKQVLDYYNSNGNMSLLILGKCSLTHTKIIDELLIRKVLQPPKYTPEILIKPAKSDELIDFLVKSLK